MIKCKQLTFTQCYIYGSHATGLCLPWSDIDIVVKPNTHSSTQIVLELISQTLKKRDWADNIKVIPSATVPVIKIVCSNHYLNKRVDITIHDPGHNGLACVELVKSYMDWYPNLKPLTLVLKQFLYYLNLNDTYYVSAC